MLRLSAAQISSFQRSRVFVHASRHVVGIKPAIPSTLRSQGLLYARALSSKSEDKTKKEGEESTADEIVLTPGEKVVAATRLGWYLGLAGFAAACAYFIGKELIPT